MERVVIDTNVIISGLIKAEGVPGKILKAWRKDKFILLISPPIFEEISKVIRREEVKKYHKMEEKEIDDFLFNLYSATQETSGELELHVVEDAYDNVFLACAIEGDAHYVVTGDKLFLKLKEYNDWENLKDLQ